MAVRNSASPMTLVTVDSATFAGAYVVLTAGLSQPLAILNITNGSTMPITISYDGGTTDHGWLPANGSMQVELQTNGQPNNFNMKLAQGTKISVKGAVGVGLVYLFGWYQISQT